MAYDHEKNKQYKREHTKTLAIRFFPTDMAILDYIKSQDNIAQYIKNLVIADMKNNNIEVVINKKRSKWDNKKED